MEVVDGDDDDQDEAAGSNAAEMTPAPISRAVSEPAPSRPPGKDEDDGQSKPASPKPHPLSISFKPPTPTPGPDDDGLGDALRPPQEGVDDFDADMGGDMSLDMTGMGPDGEQFEGAQDMSQLQPTDALLGGPLMDEAMGDPFTVPPS